MSARLMFFTATGSPVGGIETWLDRIVASCETEGLDPVVALVRGSVVNSPDRFLKWHHFSNTIEVDGRGCDRRGRINAAMRAIRHCRPDVVLPSGVLDACDAAAQSKIKGDVSWTVAAAHGNIPAMLADLEDRRPQFDRVVCPGALTARYLVEQAMFDQDRVSHIPNGADCPKRTRSVRATGAPLRLAYIGRFTNGDKRVLDLPGFCEQLALNGTDYELSIVGAGPREAELRSELQRYGSRVKMLGPMSHDRLYDEVFPNIDVLLLFSASEAFGIVLAEAMVHGVVPVSSEYAGFHSEQLVVDEVCGLSFPVGRVDVAAAKTHELFCSDGKLLRLSQQAQAHARDRYTWELCGRRWVTCFREVMSRPPLPACVQTEPNKVVNGRLDRLGVPRGVVEFLRRSRRAILGSPVPPGGEEWPLFSRLHPAERLECIHRQCMELESNCTAG